LLIHTAKANIYKKKFYQVSTFRVNTADLHSGVSKFGRSIIRSLTGVFRRWPQCSQPNSGMVS